MKNTIISKTLTASLQRDPQAAFEWISDPANLPAWAAMVGSPGGPLRVRFIREDRARVVDILVQVSEGVELTHAIRLVANGEGSEIVWTLVKPEGLSDSAFQDQLRWAANALNVLRKAPPVEPAEPVEPLQAPSASEVQEMPPSGRKLFIGNLSYVWTEVELRAHCAEAGAVVTAEIARFRGRGGRSRGFGFVEMATDTEAQSAIEKLHGSLAGGRQIIVHLAKSQENRPAAKAAARVSSRPETGRAPSRSGSVTPRRGGRPRQIGTQSYPTSDIQNKSGYEIFPRRSQASSEPSPYMEDTGDIENHGRRPPRRGRGR